MTSFALAAHATKASPAFNGLFYATAATVIPVLLLAIAVQGSTYENLLKVASRPTSPNGPCYQRGAASVASIMSAGVAGQAAGGFPGIR